MEDILQLICVAWVVVAAGTYVLLQFVTAPFGRHTASGWGPVLDNKLGWCLMELPSLLLITASAIREYSSGSSSYASVLYALWILHYTNRSIVYPLRIKATPKPMPALVALCAFGFNLVNAGLNGASLLRDAAVYDATWLFQPRTILGLALFFCGMSINWVSDEMLIRLRKPGETGYKIPHGFLFEYVSCPNHLGECIEWVGFALMAGNLAASTFAIWTLSNLVPRAASHHAWYKAQFKDYPLKRQAIIPFLY
ncbi:3-oxo-5-alpha-steroid 4-dehydrogenase family protein [Achlya hypogyna]|uniref:3-oxo-5-alpha-steroid 4-dehydrogenase 1 n=1 Tax=Achlya hypogyna TaxID=1202772 RepID=A0A1V9YKM4_ACHHY|nr:3-oxo-5-alpha-steroid 4-dehydrogenase family protein [Achlya hypogyna]